MIQGTYRIHVQCLLAENIEDDDQKGHWEKGYDLPVDENEGKEAEADLRAALEYILLLLLQVVLVFLE